MKPRRCLIRAVPGIVVGPAHYDYVTPDGRNLWGDEYGHPLKLTVGTRRMVMQHRNAQRLPGRRQAALDYYKAREATGAERHRKPLPSSVR